MALVRRMGVSILGMEGLGSSPSVYRPSVGLSPHQTSVVPLQDPLLALGFLLVESRPRWLVLAWCDEGSFDSLTLLRCSLSGPLKTPLSRYRKN